MFERNDLGFLIWSGFQASVGWIGASGLQRGEGGKDDGRMKIHHSVLQDIRHLGPLPKISDSDPTFK